MESRASRRLKYLALIRTVRRIIEEDEILLVLLRKRSNNCDRWSRIKKAVAAVRATTAIITRNVQAAIKMWSFLPIAILIRLSWTTPILFSSSFTRHGVVTV